MSKYTNEEQEFLDKAAITTTNAMVSTISSDLDYDRVKYWSGINGFKSVSEWIASESYKQAKALLTERKKLFGDE